jgi:hypothetical protein
MAWSTLGPAVVSRTSILILTLVLGMAAYAAVHNYMPLVLDAVEAIEVSIEKSPSIPFALIALVALLVVTIGAGAWVTVMGIRIDGKRERVRQRRRSRA